jgi:hypothetical protein
MTALLVAVSILLALVLVLVAGLLRSHAEILRRLHNLESDADGEELPVEESAPRRDSNALAAAIDGFSLDGDAVRVDFAPGAETLIAFLTSGCSVCRDLWAELGTVTIEGMAGLRIVIVAKDRKLESVVKLRRLAPEQVSVVLSSAAWDEYSVPASPYFVHIGENGEIAGEGVSSTWEGVRSLLSDARADIGSETGADGVSRMQRAEAELVGAGLAPSDASLYGDVERKA